LSLLGCASAPRAEPAHAESLVLSQLTEREAISIVDRLLLEQRQQPVTGWRVRLPRRAQLDVDVRLGDSPFGVEWVSRQDRALLGSNLPEPDPSGQLRVVRGEAAREPALILLLDDRSYRLVRGADAQGSDEDERALEDRLRQDLRDFIEYAQSQYAQMQYSAEIGAWQREAAPFASDR
jgi:hypothetical protein